MQGQMTVQERYQAAVDQLAERLEEDYYVLALLLYGSVVRGEAWERSDIDVVIILRDGQERDNRHVWLVEDDLNISAEVVSRNRLKRELDGALQGSWIHSIRSQYKVVFSKDESITEWLRDADAVGAHDQAMQLLRLVSWLQWPLDKANKWFYAKHDLNYCCLWLLQTVNELARIEVVLAGKAPGREALDQALKLNPVFFTRYYVDLINGPKTDEVLEEGLRAVEGYLEARAGQIFKPLLDYLAEAGGPVPAREIIGYFEKKLQGGELSLSGALDWLTRHGTIQKLSTPVHLTRKSQVTVEMPSFYYDPVEDEAYLNDWQ